MSRVAIVILAAILVAAPWLVGAKGGPALTATAAEFLEKGDQTFRSRSYAEATTIYERAVKAAEAEKNRTVLVEAHSMVARGHLVRDQGEQGRPYLERAKGLASPEDPSGWSRYLGVRGRFEWKDDDKPAAMKTFETMFDYCLRHDLHSRAVDAAHMVAITGTPEEQIEWAKKGIARPRRARWTAGSARSGTTWGTPTRTPASSTRRSTRS